MDRYALSMRPEFARVSMSPREREIRARAAQLLSQAGLLHGSWIDRERICGRASCRCATPGGAKHPATYVYRQQEGKLRQLYVSIKQRGTVQRWLRQDRELRELLEELWEIHWQRVRAGEAEG